MTKKKTMEATGFIDILAKEGTALGLPIRQACDGRHCFALVTLEQRKMRRARQHSEKWVRENLLWLAIPMDRRDLLDAVCRHHLGHDQEFKATYSPGFPLGVLEAVEAVPQPVGMFDAQIPLEMS